MANAFESYQRGQAFAMQQGQNALRMEQALQKEQRDRQLRDILAGAYTQPQAGIPAQAEIPAMGASPAMGPTQGTPLPDYPAQAIPAQAAVPAQAGGMDMQSALDAMYQGGFGPEAMSLEASQAKLRGATPSAVNEYEYYKNLPTDEAREQFLAVKRSKQYLDIGSGFVAPSQVTPTAPPKKVVTRELKPTETTGYIGEKAETTKKATMSAEAQTKAQLSLQKNQLQYEKNISLVDDILKHPGLEGSFGKMGMIPSIPGSDKANFKPLLEQLQNTVFITNREALKGGGAITDFEGTKAEQAELRASRAQSADEFRKAMADYKKWVNKGFDNMKKAAKGDFSIKDVQAPRSNQDKQALKWANANPNDPRAMQIFKRLGR